MTLLEFIESQPGMYRYAIHQYERIDKVALEMGVLLKLGRSIATLRKLAVDPALTPSLRAQNAQAADAWERDPSGRLAAVPSLVAWAYRADIDQEWITWYARYLVLWIDAQKAPPLVPLAEPVPVESVLALR